MPSRMKSGRRAARRSRQAVKVEVAGECGFCFGVKRAVRLARKAAKGEGFPVYSLGPLMHNPQEVRRLEAEGIKVVKTPSRVRRGAVIVRSHGVEPAVVCRLKARGIKVVDATCPFVKRAQQLARKLASNGYSVVIVGDRQHPEVKAIVASAGRKASVVEHVGDLRKLKLGRKVGVLSQTTQAVECFAGIISLLVVKAEELRVYNTICLATARRQDEARRLAGRADLALVVGGRVSANTRRLAEICREAGAETHHVESAADLRARWFPGKRRIVITGGASTPGWIIEEVRNRVFSFTGPAGAC